MAGSKILLIDGDDASRTYITTVLERQGYAVLVAASGKEGLVAAWRDLPNLILADPVLPDVAGEELAARLRADPRTAKLPLVALSSDPKPGRRQSCLNAGFNEYLVKSPQLVPNLSASLAKLLEGEGAASRAHGRLVAFLSAKGGTGTSSLCANLAMSMAEDHPEISVVVADLVLPIGSIADIVGYEGSENLVTIAHMPLAEATPDYLWFNLTTVGAWHFRLLPGSPDPEQANQLEGARVGGIVSALRSAFDFVLVDLGRSLSRISLPLIEESDLVVMVVGPDMSTVSLSKTVWEYLHETGVAAASVYPILNRAVGLEGLTKAEVENVIGLQMQTSMPHLGGNLSVANNQHLAFSHKFPLDTATIILRDTAQQIMAAAQRQSAG
jgi:CheY-like chemotaxis protein/MinD-like ATPase involved in chromosome partitioning or flagellar assembly